MSGDIPRGYVGSSPHTRGAQLVREQIVDVAGIIPAYAGSTSGRRRVRLRLPDHPRIRGEHHAKAFEAWNVQGSSPHTRGARGHGGVRPSPIGSSPHTRGARVVARECLLRQRIIPAYAGSTLGSFLLSFLSADHPRIRGEHSLRLPDIDPRWGSSPHTRGARSPRARCSGSRGIIPAYAGSTRDKARDDADMLDHPRIRGEHSHEGVHFAWRPRIIPAYAGSTRRRSRQSMAFADHPRIRGEHIRR